MDLLVKFGAFDCSQTIASVSCSFKNKKRKVMFLVELRYFTRRITTILKFFIWCVMISFWGLLFQFLGIFRFFKFILKDPDLGPILMVMVIIFIFFELVYTSSSYLIELVQEKKYLSWKIILFVISAILVVGTACLIVR